MKKKRFLFATILVMGMVAGCKNKQADNVGFTVVTEDTVTAEHHYEGVYLDEDNSEPNLFIHYRDSDDTYSVEIGIFRLTSLDDGVGVVRGNVLDFTATDANGNPIGGEITLNGDTAVVTFTRSTWPLLENGSKFNYVRQVDANLQN